MGKGREFDSPEELEAASPPKGLTDSGMDVTFMRPYWHESWTDLAQGELGIGLPVADFDHTRTLELLEERQRERQGPPNRTLGKGQDEFKFRTEEYYLSLQEWAQKVKERKKAAKQSGRKKVQKRRRKPKAPVKIVGIRIIEQESVEVGQQEPRRIIKIVDNRDCIENLRFGATPAGFRSNRESRR